jgi:hypothetical protein
LPLKVTGRAATWTMRVGTNAGEPERASSKRMRLASASSRTTPLHSYNCS